MSPQFISSIIFDILILMKNKIKYGWTLCIMALFVYSCDLINKDSRLTPNKPVDGTILYTTPKNGVVMNLLQVDKYKNASGFRIASQPKNGTAGFIKDATLLYTPDTTKNISSDSFVLSITTDSVKNTTELDTVIIKFVPKDSIPCNSAAVADAYVTQPNVPIALYVLGNDSFCEGELDSTSLQLTQATTHGTVSIRSDHRIVYTPNANYEGYDFFIYKVCNNKGECAEALVKILVQSSSSVCPGAKDDNYTLTQDTLAPYPLSLFSNDSFCTDSIDYGSFTVIRQPQHGELSIGKSIPPYVAYKAATGFTGSDSFRYRLCSTSGKCSEAEVKINVVFPVCTNELVSDTLIYKVTSTYDTLYTKGASISVLDNDKLNCGITTIYGLAISKQPLHGTAYIIGGRLYYTPATGYKGTDTVEYGICLVGNPQSCQQRATVYIDIK